MMEELSYGIFDWINYVKGCMSIFNESDFLKVIGVLGLKRHLRDTVGLEPEKIELLLQDNALSQNDIKDLTRDEMMPMTNYRGNLRFLRIRNYSWRSKNCGMGIENFSIAIRVFFDSLEYGTLRIPRIQQSGPFKSAIGILQLKQGGPFRYAIASKCVSLGYRAEVEWPIIPDNSSESKRIGTINILVIGQNKRPFILVEAKYLLSQGIVPKEMKEQRDRFLGRDG